MAGMAQRRRSRRPSSPHERRARVARPVAYGALAGSFVFGALNAAGTGPVFGLLAWLLILGLGVVVLLNAALGWHLLNPYPEIPKATQKLWLAAGATGPQLAALNEAHRLRRLTPPVGYGDRRTLANPLADAYAITTSAAWSDPWLADRRLLIDPVAEAHAILESFHKITALAAEARRRQQAAPPGSSTRAAYALHEQALGQALDETLRRAGARARYRIEVQRLERLLADQRSLPEAQAFADRVLDVLSETAQHAYAVRHLEDSQAQLRMLEATLREITDLLTGADALLPPPPGPGVRPG